MYSDASALYRTFALFILFSRSLIHCFFPTDRSLNLESLLQTVLRPLRYIDSSVRQQFAQTMRELELGVVEPYLGRASLHSMGGTSPRTMCNTA